MSLVIDASIACKWLVEEDGSPQAGRVLETGDSLLAPDFIITEVATVLWNKNRTGEISREHGERALASLPDFFDDLISCRNLSQRAFDIATSLDHPVYDCFYLSLAVVYDYSLVTADARLLKRLEGSPWSGYAISPEQLENRL